MDPHGGFQRFEDVEVHLPGFCRFHPGMQLAGSLAVPLIAFLHGEATITGAAALPRCPRCIETERLVATRLAAQVVPEDPDI
jgi:hypothetical protein